VIDKDKMVSRSARKELQVEADEKVPDGEGLNRRGRAASEKSQGAGKPPSLSPAPFPKTLLEGNGGKLQDDLASALARAVLENNLEAVYEGLARELMKGNATVFKALAERGYGKLQEIKEFTHRIEDMSDAELDERIRQLEHELGVAREAEQVGGTGGAEKGRQAAKRKTKA
jgi:hypothetical protein